MCGTGIQSILAVLEINWNAENKFTFMTLYVVFLVLFIVNRD